MCLPGCGSGLSHGVVGVDPAVPEAGIVTHRTEVLGGGLHALTDRVRRHAPGGEQPGEARHEGRRHASSAHPAVSSRHAGGEYARPRRCQIHPVAAAGETGEPAIRGGGAHGDHLRIRRRVLRHIRPFIAGRRHHDSALAIRAVDRHTQHAGVSRSAEREVHDVGTVVHAPLDALHYPRVCGEPYRAHDLGYEESALEASPSHALAVVRERARYACYVGAVPVVVVGHSVALDEVSLSYYPAYIRMIRVGARVHYGDLRAIALCVAPGTTEPRADESPLVTEHRVVWNEVRLAQVVVVNGFDRRFVPEIRQCPCEGSLPHRLGCLAPDRREGDESHLPWQILKGPRSRPPDDGLFGLLGGSRLVCDE